MIMVVIINATRVPHDSDKAVSFLSEKALEAIGKVAYIGIDFNFSFFLK